MKADITFGVIGRINESLFDGQTVKTRTLTSALRRCYPNCNILMAESSLGKRNLPRLLLQLFHCVRKSDVIFVLLSRNGLRILLPVLFFLNRFYKKPVIHDCIGGAHDLTLSRYPFLKKYYRKMAVNWVETEILKQNLEKQGLTNVEILTNFKDIWPISPDAVTRKDTSPYRFCTFSRVNEKKGIGRAAEAVLAINGDAAMPLVQLDVYGPIEENFDTILNDYIRRANGAIAYCGVADPNSSVSILQQYYGMLLPTGYIEEGIPGTVIDAFCSGLPVIATGQRGIAEIVEHRKTGFLYAPDEPEKLREWMEYAFHHPEEFHEMRFACLEAAERFTTKKAAETICRKVEELL